MIFRAKSTCHVQPLRVRQLVRFDTQRRIASTLSRSSRTRENETPTRPIPGPNRRARPEADPETLVSRCDRMQKRTSLRLPRLLLLQRSDTDCGWGTELGLKESFGSRRCEMQDRQGRRYPRSE